MAGLDAPTCNQCNFDIDECVYCTLIWWCYQCSEKDLGSVLVPYQMPDIHWVHQQYCSFSEPTPSQQFLALGWLFIRFQPCVTECWYCEYIKDILSSTKLKLFAFL